MFTNKVEPTRHEVPNEPGEWIEFRPLSWRQLEDAKQARTLAAIKVAGQIPPEVYERMSHLQERGETSDLETTDEYDKAAVLAASIAEWSYVDVELTPENIDGMDGETSAWAHRIALDLSLRSRSEGEVSAPSSNGSTSGMGAGPAS